MPLANNNNRPQNAASDLLIGLCAFVFLLAWGAISRFLIGRQHLAFRLIGYYLVKEFFFRVVCTLPYDSPDEGSLKFSGLVLLSFAAGFGSHDLAMKYMTYDFMPTAVGSFLTEREPESMPALINPSPHFSGYARLVRNIIRKSTYRF